MNEATNFLSRYRVPLGRRPIITPDHGEQCRQGSGAQGEWQIVPAKVRRDSQGSLPKTALNAYLDEIATEL
jgi:hypothetical protein